MVQSIRLSVRLSVQQSYLLWWELLPDRNRISMGLWYWELMSHPDPAVLPVGTLHYLEWFWVSRRIFIYSHHNTFAFSLRRPSVRHTFLIMFPSSYHHEVFRSYYQWQKWCQCKRSRSKVKVTEVMTPFSRFWTVTPVWLAMKLQWNDAYSLVLLGAAFLDSNSSLNSPMATKCCTKLEVA